MAAAGPSRSEQQLMATLWAPEIKDNPLNFVMFAYPWGEPNTPLAGHSGPRSWQKDILGRIARNIAENRKKGLVGIDPEMLREAIASGRGIGKSTFVAWLAQWMMTCHVGSTTIITANTEAQLSSRTMAEMGKWHSMLINAHWFDRNTMALRPHKWLVDLVKKQLKIDAGYWYAQAQLWTEDNPDAFAGVHNPHGLMLLFDEASGIPEPIWTVSEGFFTEPELYRFWLNFSNPRRNTGAFFNCFHRDRNYWDTLQVDSRTVEGTDLGVYQKIIEKYGEDSDEARVEVKGQFPRRGDSQFIAQDDVAVARLREISPDPGAPLIMGIDPARFGDDRTVFAFRQGRDARSIPWMDFKGLSTDQVADRAAEAIDRYKPDAVFCDGGGVGGGVVDQLKRMGYRCSEVQFGSRADAPEEWANRRTEIWAKMRDSLSGLAIPDSQELEDDLVGPEYAFVGDSSKVQLESKDKMKKRGLASPDYADALALTFDRNVARRPRDGQRRRKARMAEGHDYSVV